MKKWEEEQKKKNHLKKVINAKPTLSKNNSTPNLFV